MITLKKLIEWATDKKRFSKVDDYASFSEAYLTFLNNNGLQAVIVSKNENNYNFFQYRKEGYYNVSRPININLMFTLEDFIKAKKSFEYSLKHIKEIQTENEIRNELNKFVYTCQQAIGATLDALPSGKSNTARKINGDLFEQYIRLIITDIGISVRQGTIKVPIITKGKKLFDMSYQHDLIVEKENIITAIGSVKTSSKDRIDKIFIDKFLYNRLTNADTPHFAVFLNDIQRKGKEQNFGVNTTFLANHFKGYTVKLNPLDGVYYCDLRPNMINDHTLKKQIRPLDCLLVEDIWKYV